MKTKIIHFNQKFQSIASGHHGVVGANVRIVTESFPDCTVKVFNHLFRPEVAESLSRADTGEIIHCHAHLYDWLKLGPVETLRGASPKCHVKLFYPFLALFKRLKRLKNKNYFICNILHGRRGSEMCYKFEYSSFLMFFLS